jgi:hypothetical protein
MICVSVCVRVRVRVSRTRRSILYVFVGVQQCCVCVYDMQAKPMTERTNERIRARRLWVLWSASRVDEGGREPYEKYL